MSLEDTLSATLDEYDRLAPDAGEVQAWLAHRLALSRHSRVRPLAGLAGILVIITVAITINVFGGMPRGSTRPVGAEPSASVASTPFRYTKSTLSGALIPAPQRYRAENMAAGLLDGNGRFSLDTFRGRVIVLTWSASWCGPCRTQYTAQLRAQNAQRTDAATVTIATRDDQHNATSFFKPNIAHGLVAFDEHATTLREFGGLPTNGLPLTVVIDRQFRVAAVYDQAVDPAVLAHLVSVLGR